MITSNQSLACGRAVHPVARHGAGVTVHRLTLLLLAASAIAFAQKPFRPAIPKVWDEEELRTFELPLATPEASPRHISAGRYYAIPEQEIFQSYPLTMPGKTEEEYHAWLREQEPRRIDTARLTTKQDWIDAGRAVFEWPAGGILSTRFSSARVVIREKGKIEYGALHCAGCHTRVMDDGPEIRGGQINAARLWRSATPPTLQSFAAFLESRGADLSAPWLEPDPNAAPDALEIFARLRTRVPGIAARFHTSLWSPANTPSLIGVRDIKYLDRTGHARHRDIGDLMRYAAFNFGGGGMSLTSSFGKHAGRIGPSLRRVSDAHLYALALYVYSLEPPKNPHRFDAIAERGQKIFAREGCNGCHPAPLYTNNKLTPAPGFRVPDEHQRLYDVMPVSVGTDPWLAMKTKRGTGYYKVPSLRGVWYRGPFEHNGSVLTLEDWFDPARLRDDYVPTGWPGPEPNRAVRGHEFGLKLNPEDKKALLAFLRTL